MVTIKTEIEIVNQYNELRCECNAQLKRDFSAFLKKVKKRGFRKWANVEEQQKELSDIIKYIQQKTPNGNIEKEVFKEQIHLLCYLEKVLFGDIKKGGKRR